MTPDLVNSIFLFFAGVMIACNVVKLYRDKQVHGVHFAYVLFMSAWGFYSLYFLAYYTLWLSLASEVMLVTMNTIWAIQILYYRRASHETT